MTTTTLKKKIQECINHIDDAKILEAVYTILNSHSSQHDFWDELSNEQKKAIDSAIKEADEGKLTSHKAVMKKLKNK